MINDDNKTGNASNLNIILEDAISKTTDQLNYLKDKVAKLENNFSMISTQLIEKKLESQRSKELIKIQEHDILQLKQQQSESINSKILETLEAFQSEISDKLKKISENMILYPSQENSNVFESNKALTHKISDQSSQFDLLVSQIKELSSSIDLDAGEEEIEDLSDMGEEEYQNDRLNLISENFTSLIEKLNQTQSELDKIKFENESLIEDSEDLNAKNESPDPIYNLEQENSELTERISFLEENNAEIQKDNNEKNRIFAELKDEITKYIAENKELKQNIEKTNKDLKNSHDVADQEELEEEIEFYKNLIIEKDQEIVVLKSNINSRPQKLSEGLANLSEDELLLKLSELELEEASWQDEKRVLLEKLDKLKSQEREIVPEELEKIKESILIKDNVIEALRTEILELGQDIDNADDEIDQLNIENSNLKLKLGEIEVYDKNGETMIEGKNTNKQQLEQFLGSLLPKKDEIESQEENISNGVESLMSAIGNASVFNSLVDQFLKPSVQITYLVKQGDWDHISLAETVSVSKSELNNILKKLAEEGVVKFDDYKIWWVGESET